MRLGIGTYTFTWAIGVPGSTPARRMTALDLLEAAARLPIRLLNGGWPINFDGDVEDMPADEIQLTRALMFAGALQAASIRSVTRPTVVKFDPEVDRLILDRFKRLRRGRPLLPIGDPEAWKDVVVDVAERLARLHD